MEIQVTAYQIGTFVEINDKSYEIRSFRIYGSKDGMSYSYDMVEYRAGRPVTGEYIMVNPDMVDIRVI